MAGIKTVRAVMMTKVSQTEIAEGGTISEEIEVGPLGLMTVADMTTTKMMASGLHEINGGIAIGTIVTIKAGDDLEIEVIVILGIRDVMKIIVVPETEIVTRTAVQIGIGTGIVTGDCTESVSYCLVGHETLR
jgi:hypothetical protein